MKLPPPLPPLQSRPVPEWAQRSGKYSPVPTYNGPKLKECILEGVELMDAFSNDFQAVIGAQRSKTEFFRVHLVCLRPPPCPTRSFPMTRSINTNQRPYGNVIPYTMLSYFETREKFVFRFLNALEQTLQSRKQLLKVENCSMEVIKCEQLLQILPNIDSKYLKSIEISSPKICPHEEFEMDRLVTSNQWRKAKTFDLRSFYVSTPINNFLHFNSAKFHIHSVCCEDLKTMQQVFINSSNFESFEIGYNNFEGRENLIQTFGEAETNGLPYKPVRKLGNGSFGEVFLMEHIRAPNITAAVKVLEVDYCRKAEILEEFHLHKKLCRTVHQNIINLYWMHRTSDCIYFVMEDVDGGTLFDKFETNKIEPAAAQNYFKQLIAGLKYIHGQGIVHRDIKPENLLITSKEELKICDFGAAMRYRYGAEEILLGSGVGSAEYTAPELYASLKCRGPPLDVWSAGVTLMLIVSGLQLWKYADIESPGYVDWIKGKTLSRKPWDEMDVSLIKLLRKVVTDKVDKRWTLERIEKCKWMKFDYGPIKKNKKKW
ncbi:hypothetical protein L5515_009037 [Caenorhabditis briggsae]|uniref:Protein kinase domain-containing protein n=1 Tax=Caenorhabditis briggsae TaxID=6238 RepID=A0AAE9F317_CAEBR|nr:hypothetical protein L5515_009037 [Caenorhabditis briggsae]